MAIVSEQPKTSLIYLGGSKRSFRCEAEGREGARVVKCGSNCFHHPDPEDNDLWECNACGAHYRSD